MLSNDSHSKVLGRQLLIYFAILIWKVPEKESVNQCGVEIVQSRYPYHPHTYIEEDLMFQPLQHLSPLDWPMHHG